MHLPITIVLSKGWLKIVIKPIEINIRVDTFTFN